MKHQPRKLQKVQNTTQDKNSLGWSTFCLLDSDSSTGLSYLLFEKLGPEGEGHFHV